MKNRRPPRRPTDPKSLRGKWNGTRCLTCNCVEKRVATNENCRQKCGAQRRAYDDLYIQW